MGINIMHYGQLLLPIISLILFIDSKFRFKVNDTKTFIVLCLFSLSFFAFSYKLGFYSVMGFTLPMAYYIGSNMYKPDEKKVKYVIYIIAFGMASYLIINMFYEFNKFGLNGLFHKIVRSDFWLNGEMAATAIAINSIIPLSVITYIVFKEKNSAIKIIGIICEIAIVIYCAALGRRTPLALLFIVFFVSFALELFGFKNKNIYKSILKTVAALILIFIILCLLYVFNIFGFKDLMSGDSILMVLLVKGLRADRFIIVSWGAKYLPKYLWGGQIISGIIGYQFHDLLLDIYDYAGIVPFTLMLMYCISCILVAIKVLVSKTIDSNYKLLLICVMLSIGLMMAMEPIMTGCSMFLICSILIFSSIDSLNTKKK